MPIITLLFLCQAQHISGTIMSIIRNSGPKAVTAFGPDTHPSCLHLTSNQQQLENQTAYVVTNAIVMSS